MEKIIIWNMVYNLGVSYSVTITYNIMCPCVYRISVNYIIFIYNIFIIDYTYIKRNLLAELKKCSLINFFNKKVAQFADF